MRRLRVLAIFVAAFLLVAVGGVLTAFLVQNSHYVVGRFPLLRPNMADPVDVFEADSWLSVVMAACFLVGVLVATLAYVPLWARRSWERNRDRTFIDALAFKPR